MTKFSSGMRSSNTYEWGTPADLFVELNNKWNFTLDPCCSEKNKKCEYYYTVKDNGLLQCWEGERVFMNPPYGREISKWVGKAYVEAVLKKHCFVVALLPARTDTKWWQTYVKDRAWIEFLPGRLKFEGEQGAKNPAPFPSAIVVF